MKQTPYKFATLGSILLSLVLALAAFAEDGLRQEAWVLLKDQVDLMQAQRYAEASERAWRSFALFKRLSDRKGQAYCLTLIGSHHALTQDFAAAEEPLERAQGLLRASGQPLWSAAVAHMRARLLRARNQTEEAFQVFQEGLALVDSLKNTSTPLSLDGADLYAPFLEIPFQVPGSLDPSSARGRAWILGRAEASLRKELAITEILRGRLREAEREEVDEVWSQVGRAIAALGSDQAREKAKLVEALFGYAVQGEPIDETLARNDGLLKAALARGDLVAEAMLLRNRGNLLKWQGAAEEALATLEQAARLAGETHEPYVEARILSSLATHRMATGQLEEAAAVLEEARIRYQDLGEPMHELYSNLLLATIYWQLKAFKPMAMRVERVKVIAQEHGLIEGELMPEIFATLGEKDLSEEAVRKGILALEALVQHPEFQAIITPSKRAMTGTVVDFVNGKPVVGIQQSLRDTKATARSLDDRRDQFIASLALGHLYARQGKEAEALREWRSALAGARLLGNKGQEAIVYSEISRLHWVGGRREEARRASEKAVAAVEASLEDVVLDELALTAQGSTETIYGRMIEILLLSGDAEAAFAYSERARSRALLRLLAHRKLRTGAGEGSEWVQQAEEARARIGELERRIASEQTSKPLREERREAWRRYEDLLLRIRLTQRREYASLVHVNPPPPAEIRRQALPEDTTLISFFSTGERLVAWVIDREHLELVNLPVSPKDLTRLADSLRPSREVPARGVRPIAQEGPMERSLRELYRHLVTPLLPFVEHRNLILVPHGVLHNVPFAALRNPQSDRYLVEDYTVSYAPSASALVWMRDKITPMHGRALVLGAPETADPALPSLPGSGKEARRVAALWRTEPLLGADASEAAVYAHGAEVDVLHIAAHGIFRSDNPLFSYLALTPTSEEDGRLEMGEVFARLDLTGVNLVVLSACQSGLGDQSGGDEVVGLTRAFLYAGAPAIMATLWRIDDAASIPMMEDFYRHLSQGESVAGALRGAQLAMMKRDGYADPYFWAAFKLTGDPGGDWKMVDGQADPLSLPQ